MKKQILKRIFSSISATTLAATSLGLNTVLTANAENATPAAHVHEAEELTEAVSGHDDCHDECCDDHAHGGKGVTIALLDAGVTNSETAGKTSFIDDDTIGSDHGNDMMNIISSVAPEADVLDVRVLDDEGKGTYETVEKGIRWSVDNNADIIVMSFVGDKSSALLESALAYAEEHDVLVVASAGNYSSSTALYPAAYPTVVSVGAVDENGNVQDYSNFGDYVDTYVEWNDGTSGAAQYIAATAAVTMEQNPGITVSELRASYNADKAPVETSNEDNADTVVYSAATCIHSFNGQFTTSKNPTCTAAGEKVGKCTKCGAVLTRSVLKALGHSYDWVYVKNATCTATGLKQYKCKRCGHIAKTAIVDKLQHTFNGSFTITKNATCTTAGEKVGKCTKCGTVVTRVTVKAYGHSWSSWTTTKSATCTVAGSKSHKCSRCGKTETATIPKVSHTFNGQLTTSKNPTCTAAGEKVGKCTKCGTVVTRTPIKALGHSYEWVYVKNATCTATGLKQYKCKRCGHIAKTATVDKLQHTFNGSFTLTKNATCTTAGEKVGKCTKCGTVVTRVTVKAYGHSWSSWTTTKHETCAATGTKVHKCSRCGKTETATISKLSHTFNGQFTTSKNPTCTAAGEKVGKCTKCGTVVTRTPIKALGHSYEWVYVKNATCTATGLKQYKCKRCGNIAKSATIGKIQHTFNGSFTITKNATCTTAGEKVGKCTKCGTVVTRVNVKPYGHSYAWVTVTAPTCTSAGTKHYKCTRCGSVSKKASIPKIGGQHNFNGSYTILKNPTCTTAGEKVGKCTKCGTIVSRVTLKPEHSYGSWQIIKKATCTENGARQRVCTICKYKQVQAIEKLSKIGHTFNGSFTITKNPTSTTAGEKVGKCTKCGAVVTRVTIPPLGQNCVVGPAGGYSVTYRGESDLTFTVSGNEEMFGSKVKYTTTLSNNIFVYKIYVNYNASKNKRSGVILVKKNGQTKGQINVTQDGIYLKVEPEFDHKVIRGKGQIINYSVTTNVQVKAYYKGESDTGAKGLIQSLGSDQTTANKNTTHKIKVSYPANNLDRWKPISIGVDFVAGSVSQSYMYEQASTNNAKHGYTSDSPLGTIRYNGYDYKITVSDMKKQKDYLDVYAVHERKIDPLPAFAGFNISSGAEGSWNILVSVLSGFIMAINDIQVYDVTFHYYVNTKNSDDRVVTILVHDGQIAKAVDNPIARPIKSFAGGKTIETYFDECRLCNDDLQLTLDETGNWVESFRSFSNDSIKIDGIPNRFTIPHYQLNNPSQTDGPRFQNDYSSPFPILNVNRDLKETAEKALARTDYEKSTEYYD